jgi:RND family efflux transporter MFP subunit
MAQNSAADLSRLKINRDEPSRGTRRGLKWALVLFGTAVTLVAALLVWQRVANRGVAVRTAVAQLSGGGQAAASLSANGYVVAETKASVSSRVPGRLEELRATEGTRLQRGEIIGRLENRDYQAAVSSAAADTFRARAALLEARVERDQLERDVARARDLLQRNLISQQQVESLSAQLQGAEARVQLQEAGVRSADASLELARANLENTLIRAPFTGTVLRKDAEVGEVVAPAATGGGLTRGAVVTMADLNTLQVEVDVNEAYIGRIRQGRPARIILDAYNDTIFRGEVRQVVPTANRQTATVLVKVSILDRDPRILPEMGARVEFLEGATPGDSATAAPARVYVPAEAVRTEGGQTVVWIVRNQRLERRAVQAGPVSGGNREVRSGLNGGEQVVIAGPAVLEENAKVSLTPVPAS